MKTAGMSSYPIVLTDEFCIITFSCPPTSATFDSAPAPGPMKAGREGWQGLVYQRTYPKSRFSQDTLTEYAGYKMDGIALFHTVGIDHSFWHSRTSMAFTSGTSTDHPRRMLNRAVLVVRER